MLTKTITYTDYDGNSKTEEFRFNLSKAELMELEITTKGGFVKLLQDVVAANDKSEIFKLFKTIILKSYGEKSPDGKYFYKTGKDGVPLSAAFEQTEAYTELLMEVASNADAAADFVNRILPGDLAKEANITVLSVPKTESKYFS
ncbi:MAG: hypothetical protein NC120_06085 [Ruminococcus sp.]|nr:hypothetical protein [Ruminococcus sp.]